MQKKKKITKKFPQILFLALYKKLRKKYLIKNTYIYISISTHKLYIYTHSGTTRETEEGLGGRGQMG